MGRMAARLLLRSTATRRPNHTPFPVSLRSLTGARQSAFSPTLRSLLSSDTSYGKRPFSSYPEHTVLPMPALSPTMVTGNIAQWTLNEGDKIEPGVVICEVETDKATVDYEAQDDGYLAKILIPAGTTDVDVGTPIGIVVEDAAHVDAFSDYVASVDQEKDTPAQSSPVEMEQAVEEPKAKAPVAPKPEPVPEPLPPVDASPQMQAGVAAVSTPVVVGVQEVVKDVDIPFVVSPLRKMLFKEQEAFEEKYGTTLMRLPSPKAVEES